MVDRYKKKRKLVPIHGWQCFNQYVFFFFQNTVYLVGNYFIFHSFSITQRHNITDIRFGQLLNVNNVLNDQIIPEIL